MKQLEQAVILMKRKGGQTWPVGLSVYELHRQFTSMWKDGRLPLDMQKEYEAALAAGANSTDAQEQRN